MGVDRLGRFHTQLLVPEGMLQPESAASPFLIVLRCGGPKWRLSDRSDSSLGPRLTLGYSLHLLRVQNSWSDSVLA
jgi:hypothetical protein